MLNEDQIYEKELGLAAWYLKHKALIKKILTAVFFAFDLLMLSFIVYSLIFCLVIFWPSYQASLVSFISPIQDYGFLREFSLPRNISIIGVQTYANVKGADIVAEIANPSPRWYATFDYQFQIGDKLTDSRKSFILPGETKKIINLAVEDGNLARGLIFTNVVWQKEVNFSKISQEKLRLDIRNVKYIPNQELGVGNKIAVSRVSFELENLTAYNYSNINLSLFLNSAGQIVSVNQIPSGVLLSGQTKILEVNFFQRLPKIDSVEILPEINILDPKVFLRI